MPANRPLYLLVFLFCVFLMAAALYFQYGLGLEPCPLCMLQRGAVIGTGLVALIAAVQGPRGYGARVYAVFMALFAIAGIGLATRQLWLQSLPPDQIPACVPSIDYLFEAFPLMQALQIAMRGTGDCAEVTWRFLGLSMPAWTLFAFIGMALVALFILFRPRARGTLAAA